jgi:hypothetical protein
MVSTSLSLRYRESSQIQLTSQVFPVGPAMILVKHAARLGVRDCLYEFSDVPF